jgi:potassium-transporting ATPase KdpC subunit
MLSYIRPAVVMLALFTALTGVIYPLAMTAVIQTIAPSHANGSLIVRNGQIIGSKLIGQRFTAGGYFHARPSAAGQNGYDAAASSGSNLGPLSVKLMDRVKADIAGLTAAGASMVPADAVTASASGLDPHISPAFAALQIARVAAARGVPEVRVRDIVISHTDLPLLGIIGEPRINVLLLNLALDEALKPGAG